MVESSGGRLVIDLNTGIVLNRFIDDPEYKENFQSIERFDMDEWHKRYPFDQHVDCFDILDLGYTTKNGKQISPDYDFRYQSHWDHVYELKQILIDEAIMHIKQDFKDAKPCDALEQLLDHLPIPDLYHYLPESMTHIKKFKYLINEGLTDFNHNYDDGHQYHEGMICPNCRTPIAIFDRECEDDWIQYNYEKCKVLITIKKKEN